MPAKARLSSRTPQRPFRRIWAPLFPAVQLAAEPLSPCWSQSLTVIAPDLISIYPSINHLVVHLVVAQTASHMSPSLFPEKVLATALPHTSQKVISGFEFVRPSRSHGDSSCRRDFFLCPRNFWAFRLHTRPIGSGTFATVCGLVSFGDQLHCNCTAHLYGYINHWRKGLALCHLLPCCRFLQLNLK